MSGEVALSFLRVNVSFDFPAIFQFPSTSLGWIGIDTLNTNSMFVSKQVEQPGAGVKEVVLMFVSSIVVVVRRELSSSRRFGGPPV